MNAAPPARFPTRRDWSLLGLALMALYTVCLGTRGINEPDEGRYAEISLAMAIPGGGWWEPRMSGWGRYDKPPLICWATAASFRVFGVNDWAAQLPSLAGATLSLLGLGWAARRLSEPRTAWWAVLICGTSAQFWLLGRLLSLDMLLCGWCTLAVAAWAECRHRDGAWGCWAASLVCWTLAWWTKATPVLIPLAGLAIGIQARGDTRGRSVLRLPLLLSLVLLLGAPWYLSMPSRYPELRDFFFGRELAGRMAGSVNGRHWAFWYYLPASLLGWLPWWPVAAWGRWREGMRLPTGNWLARVRAWVGMITVEGWIVLIGLVIFSSAASKLPTSTLPLMPWAALWMAGTISRQTARHDSPPRWFLLPAPAFALCAGVGLALYPGREATLGNNSSLRRVCTFLASHGARRVDVDLYWPSMEIYLPRTALYYVVRDDAANLRKDTAKGIIKWREERYCERSTDLGKPPSRFSEITPRPTLPFDDPARMALEDGEFWLVRFVRQRDSPFNPLLGRSAGENPPELMLRGGDFRVYRTTLVHGAILPATRPAFPVP